MKLKKIKLKNQNEKKKCEFTNSQVIVKH